MGSLTGLPAFNATIQNQRTQQYLFDVLGEKKEQFVSNVCALVNNDKTLQECQPLSVIYSAINATALNLPLDKSLGFAYVLPYKNNKLGITEAQFQMGAKGYIQLAQRSGQYKYLNCRDVREGEIIGEDFLTEEMTFRKLPDAVRQNAPIIGYVGFFELVNGFRKMRFWSVQELKDHASRYSQSYTSKVAWVRDNSPWNTHFDDMARKTVLKHLILKFGPMSVEMNKAIITDQSVVDKDGNARYVDNEQYADPEENSEMLAENVKEKFKKVKSSLFESAEDANVGEE